MCDDWDFDGFWSRTDDIFLILASLLLIFFGVFLGFNFVKDNKDRRCIHHNLVWHCKGDAEDEDEAGTPSPNSSKSEPQKPSEHLS